MPPEGFGRDDLEHALDVLASEAPAPTGDAAAVVARGRRRVHQRRIALTSVAVVLIAGVASIGFVARDTHHSAVSTHAPATPTAVSVSTPRSTATTVPTTSTARPPVQLAFVSATEGWICGNPLLYTTAEFNEFTGGSKNVNIPAATGKTGGANAQQPLCAAAAGGNAWLLRASADPDQPEIVRIRSAGANVKVFPFPRISGLVVTSLDFVDANNGWALVEHAHGEADLYRTRDGGVTWSALLRGNAPLWGQLDFESTQIGWASGYALPNLATTTDGGRTWRQVDVPIPNGATQFTPVVPALVKGNTVVTYGAWDTDTGVDLQPFIDVSTDGGRTWSLRAGPAGVTVPGGATSTHIFSATDAEHWALASGNRLYLTDDGGHTWRRVAQFSGVDRIEYVARPSATSMFVSGYGVPASHATVVLGTNNGGASWTIVDSYAPAATQPDVASIPGGIIGCPTQPLTPAPPGNPPPGVTAAAVAYVRTERHYDPTVTSVYSVAAPTGGSFASVFTFNVGSCGKNVADHSWVVEMYGPTGQGGGGSTAQAQVVLAHYADGWHVFGFYH